MTARTRGARRPGNTAAKLVGTVGVVGVAAIIAGLTSFGSFTDSTTPVDTKVDSAVLSINLSDAGDSLSMPFGGGLILAGDSRSFRVDLVNDGNAALSTVTMTSQTTASSILNTDHVNGLQLTLRNCNVPWTVSGSMYSCAGTQSTFYSGPIAASGLAISGPNSVGSPAASGDAYEGATSSLEFVFNATQRTGQAR